MLYKAQKQFISEILIWNLANKLHDSKGENSQKSRKNSYNYGEKCKIVFHKKEFASSSLRPLLKILLKILFVSKLCPTKLMHFSKKVEELI